MVRGGMYGAYSLINSQVRRVQVTTHLAARWSRGRGICTVRGLTSENAGVIPLDASHSHDEGTCSIWSAGNIDLRVNHDH